MKIRLGLVLQHMPQAGGGNSFEERLLKELTLATEKWDFELVLMVPKEDKNFRPFHKVTRYSLNRFEMAKSHLRASSVMNGLLGAIGLRHSRLEKLVIAESLSGLIFGSPNHLALGIKRTAFATTVWDLGHRVLPADPDTSLGGIWEWREELFQNMVPRSSAILVDSSSTAKDLVRIYGASPERILQLGLLPDVSIDKEEPAKPDLGTYCIYPANFWTHKNHHLLLEALKIANQNGHQLNLVLTGVGPTRRILEKRVSELQLSSRVHFLGHVARDELISLMTHSLGIVMPSCLGPTNLPPIEAAILGRPSIVSNAHEMDDLLSDVTVVPDYKPSTWAKYLLLLADGKIPVPRVKESQPQVALGELLQIFGVSKL